MSQSLAKTKRSRRADLAGLQAMCAANYARLLKLLPALASSDEEHFVVDVAGAQDVTVKVVERAPYTTIIDICQHTPFSRWSSAPHFQVRLYHDARLAEVYGSQSTRHFLSSYEYPNVQMHQRDEKFQVNRFFSEWLSLCLANGRPGQTIKVNTHVVN